MKHITYALALCLTFVTAGCYHATVVTDAQPSDTVVQKNFASSWINGLVPPADLSVADECGNGVAQVETQLSLPNMIVGALTLGIYTPMTLQVTCAAGGGMGDADFTLPKDSDQAEQTKVLGQAMKASAENERPVYIRFE